MENIWLAIIAGVVGMASPLLLSWMTNRNRRLEREEDYARQDAVARQAAEAARLLLAANERVAETAAIADGKLNVIHTLVNSSMTATMRSELDATRRELVLAEEVIALKRAAGHEPSIDTLAMIEATKIRIAELEAALADRLRQSDKAAEFPAA